MRPASRHPRPRTTLAILLVALVGAGCGEPDRGLDGPDVEAALPREMSEALEGLAVAEADCIELTATDTRCFARGTGPAGAFELPVTVSARDGRSVWKVAERDVEAARNGPARQPLTLGEEITVRGERGELVGVRVTGILDPVPVSYREVPPQPGSRYLGVRVTLRNLGSRPYSDTPLATMSLRLADAELLAPVVLSEGPCRTASLARVYVLPGERTQGCAAFEVPERSRADRVALEVARNQGVLEWRLSAGAASA